MTANPNATSATTLNSHRVTNSLKGRGAEVGTGKKTGSAAWKQFERDVASLLGGTRFWANSGERLDCESPTAIAQCKLVKVLSLEALTQLAEEVEAAAAPKFKAGVVAVKVRRGRGKKSPMLLVVTEATWRRMNGPLFILPPLLITCLWTTVWTTQGMPL